MSASWVVNSLLSNGVVSMNQPEPLPLMSRVRVPELGRLLVSYPLMVAEASCPMGRSMTSILRLNGVGDLRNSVQVGTVVFWRLGL